MPESMTPTAAPQKVARPLLTGIEALRAFAALAVVVFHVIHLVGVDPPASLSFMKWYFGLGVPLFFAVSAFSLSYGYAGRLSDEAQVRSFYRRRIFRIAPLFYLATAVQVVAVWFVWDVFVGWAPLLLNLTFAFNLIPHAVDGIAPASWSIGVEMLFYLVFPAFIAVARDTRRAALLTVVLIAMAMSFRYIAGAGQGATAAFSQHSLLFNLPYFGFGVLGYQLYRHTPERSAWLLLGLAVLGLLALHAVTQAIGARMLRQQGLYALVQALWGLPFGLMCAGVAHHAPSLIANRFTCFLGRISYGLYLAHPQVIFALKGLGIYAAIQALPVASGVTFAASLAVTLAVLVPVAWALYVVVEAPGIALGKRPSAVTHASGGRSEVSDVPRTSSSKTV